MSLISYGILLHVYFLTLFSEEFTLNPSFFSMVGGMFEISV